jgi:hypothetical protein
MLPVQTAAVVLAPAATLLVLVVPWFAANNVQLYNDNSSNKIYLLGKLLWAKWLDKLKQLQEYYWEQSGKYFAMDIYDSGPDQQEIEHLYL